MWLWEIQCCAESCGKDGDRPDAAKLQIQEDQEAKVRMQDSERQKQDFVIVEAARLDLEVIASRHDAPSTMPEVQEESVVPLPPGELSAEQCLSFLFPNNQVDDSKLSIWCDQAKELLRQGQAVPRVEGILDLSNNRISDNGIAQLVFFLKNHGVIVDGLNVSGNLLHEPKAIVDLLTDHVCGLPCKNFRELFLAEAETTCECCWRILEACYKTKPKPPLSLTIIVSGEPELGMSPAACGGNLRMVVEMAERRNLRVSHGYVDNEADVAIIVKSQTYTNGQKRTTEPSP